MDIQQQVDRLIDERPGRELLNVPYDEAAFQIHERVFRSAGATASYLVDAGGERLIVNAGMGFEAPHHLRLFGALDKGPTTFVMTTQGHVDHVGGVSQFRESGTQYVAHRNNPKCQEDDKRIQEFRNQTALVWFPELPAKISAFLKDYPEASFVQDIPTPDIVFDDQLSLRAGDLEIELLHAPGGETIDSMIVWLPQHRVAIVSNLFGPLFPHFPNFNTLRGDLYRYPVPYMANVERVRALGAETLITGRHLPIDGGELIDACLVRMRDAVDFVHTRTLALINQGMDPYEIMRSVELPPELRVGQGYGKVSWAARTIFESYTGWFQRRSSAELYGTDPADATAVLAEQLGPQAVLVLARQRLQDGDHATAIRLAEAVQEADASAHDVLISAHEELLEVGDESFWESGWLRHEIARLKKLRRNV